MAAHVNGPLYSAEQIRIPPELPDILKSYTKHIIREQPRDIYGASVEYFTQLANASAQQRFRTSGMDADSLARLWTVMSAAWAGAPGVPREEIVRSCEDAGIQPFGLNDLFKLGSWTDIIPWRKFWGLAVGSVNENLLDTMQAVVRLVSVDGKTPTAPLAEIFRFLAERDPDYSPTKIDTITQAIITDPVEIPQETASALFQTHLGRTAA